MSTIRIGGIGMGGFGLFALQQFLQVPDTRLVAIAGTNAQAAAAIAQRFGAPDVGDPEAILRDPAIDLIYIATPPFLHFEQARAALLAKKHVICEKPLALTLAEADELLALAKAQDRLCATNLMQRYNPLVGAVARLIESQALGECLHGWFENYASDEGLATDHWFWDRQKSGGIFIEHGVHFFDLFAGWLGAGEVVAAQGNRRPGTEIEDQVQCTVRYPGNALVNFHHSFTQTGRLDRQELRLVFERGDITLAEWVPVRAYLRAALNEEQTRTLLDIFPGATLNVLKSFGGKDRAARGRHKELDLYQLIELRYGADHDKSRRYCELLRAFFADQLAWLRDRTHVRKSTEQNGRDSLALASSATQLAGASR